MLGTIVAIPIPPHLVIIGGVLNQKVNPRAFTNFNWLLSQVTNVDCMPVVLCIAVRMDQLDLIPFRLKLISVFAEAPSHLHARVLLVVVAAEAKTEKHDVSPRNHGHSIRVGVARVRITIRDYLAESSPSRRLGCALTLGCNRKNLVTVYELLVECRFLRAFNQLALARYETIYARIRYQLRYLVIDVDLHQLPLINFSFVNDLVYSDHDELGKVVFGKLLFFDGRAIVLDLLAGVDLRLLIIRFDLYVRIAAF